MSLMTLLLASCQGSISPSSWVLPDQYIEALTLEVDGRTVEHEAFGLHVYTRPGEEACTESNRLYAYNDDISVYLDFPGATAEVGDTLSAPSLPLGERFPAVILRRWDGMANSVLSGGTWTVTSHVDQTLIIDAVDVSLCETQDFPGDLLGDWEIPCQFVGEAQLTLVGNFRDLGWCTTGVPDTLGAETDPPLCIPPTEMADDIYWYCDQGPDAPVKPPPQDDR